MESINIKQADYTSFNLFPNAHTHMKVNLVINAHINNFTVLVTAEIDGTTYIA